MGSGGRLGTGYEKERVVRGAGIGISQAALNVGKIGGIQIGGDEVEAAAVGGGAPDADSFGGKHSVGEGYDKDAAGLEDAVDFLKDGDGMGEVLDGYGDDYGVKLPVGKGQFRVAVDVVEQVVVEVGVFGHFDGVQAQAGQAGFGMVGGPVGAPTAHQVEDGRVRRDETAESGGNGGDSASVDVDDQAGLGVKEGVVLFVLPAEVFRGKGDLRLRNGASGGWQSWGFEGDCSILGWRLLGRIQVRERAGAGTPGCPGG